MKQARFEVYGSRGAWNWMLLDSDNPEPFVVPRCVGPWFKSRSKCVKDIAEVQALILQARLEEDPASEWEGVATKAAQPKGDGSYGRGGKKR